MIITRTPFRISFCGGGSDISSFYERHGGCTISTGINKYMYISVHPSFYENTTVLKYSKTETVDDIKKIEHIYFRTVLQKLALKGVEITSTADVPSGTGLGSSSSFTVGLLHSLYTYLGKFISKESLAKEACEIEIDELNQPIGKQDQYSAAFGGLNYNTFNTDGSVFVEPIVLSESSWELLGKNLLLFYTGDVRSASEILMEQKVNISHGGGEQNLLKLCEMTKYLGEKLRCNQVDALGEILHQGWQIKKKLANGISTPIIDEYYDIARNHGAIGGKLLGAGGGGFLLFYVKERQREQLKRAIPLPVMNFQFDKQGSAVIYAGQK